MAPTLSCQLASIAAILLFQLSSLISAVPIELYGINYNTRKNADWESADVKCKTYEEITADLTLLSKLTQRIRILSLSDCGQGEMVLNVAKQLGLQVWLGLWVSEDMTVFERELSFLDTFIQNGWIDDSILGISVGSESIYREEVTVDEIIVLKDQAKDLLVENGLGDVLVSVCDIAPTYQFKTSLLPNVDVALVNSFPFWESIPIDDATDYLLEEIVPIENRAATLGKDLIMGETGWPSDGFIAGVGVAGPDEQQQFFRDFYCRMDKEMGWKYYYFTGIDNAWRQLQDENNTIEGNWGIFFDDLTIKPWFQDYEFTCPNDPSITHSFAEMNFDVPTITKPPTISPAPTPALPQNACAAHQGCADVDLTTGNCCPGDNGVTLDCCGELISGGDATTSEAGGVPGATTVEATTTSAVGTSVESSTSEPTMSPVVSPTAGNVPTLPESTPEPTSSLVSSPIAMMTPTIDGITPTTSEAQPPTSPTSTDTPPAPTQPSLAGFEFPSNGHRVATTSTCLAVVTGTWFLLIAISIL